MHILTDEPQLSAAYFIQLWLAIHGGDPAPSPVFVLRAGAAVLQALELNNETNKDLGNQVVGAMQKALATIG